MTRTSVSEVLARANAAMVGPDLDVTGALARLLAGITASLPATAAAVLVDAEGSLEVLAATSHRALDLEGRRRRLVGHHHAAALAAASARVSTRHPSAVTATVCSKCADRPWISRRKS